MAYQTQVVLVCLNCAYTTPEKPYLKDLPNLPTAQNEAKIHASVSPGHTRFVAALKSLKEVYFLDGEGRITTGSREIRREREF